MHLGELRLLLEELCCDLCRFEHVIKDRLAPETVRIDREYWLGAPGAFADIRVAPVGQLPYFVEVKFGYTSETLVRHLARKYKSPTTGNNAAKVVLVVDRAARPHWEPLERELVSCLHGGLELEVWDEDRLLALLAERFGITVPRITPDALLDVRQAIDRAKGFHAFGGPSLSE
jgi:adenylate cyclase